MTAITIDTNRPSASAAVDRVLAGLRPLVRKEFADWRHGKRAWVILGVTTAFMGLAAANSAISAWAIANLPDGATVSARITMDPLANLAAAAASQIYVVAAVFAAMGLLVVERDRGTLAWVASKPIARPAIWLAKWAAATAVVVLVAVALPMAVTVAVVIGLYGSPAVGPVLGMTVGMAAAVVLFVAIVLAASTVVGNQAGVAAIGFAALVLPTIVAGVVPFDIEPFLPTSIMGWAMTVAGGGAPAGVITPVAWIATLVALVVLAGRRMERLEL